MAPIRVLQVMPAMDAGGMETFVMNVYRTIDREKVQFDFLYHYDKPCFFDDEIRALGGRIFKLTVRQDNNLPRYLICGRCLPPTPSGASSTAITAGLACSTTPRRGARVSPCGAATATILRMNAILWGGSIIL